MSKVTLDVELRTQMKGLDDIKSRPELKLTKKQQEAYEHNKRGAETALATGDLKAFRNYFNNMAEILKKASIASGQISKNLQALTDRQEQINKDIQKLKEERDNLKKTLVTHKDGKTDISKEQAKTLLASFSKKDKIISDKGHTLSDPNTINDRVRELDAALVKAGKTWRNLTNEMARNAGFKDADAARAAHDFYKQEQNYIGKTQSKIGDIDAEITTKEAEQTTLGTEIEKIKTEAPDAAKALELIYAELSKIKTLTNTTITNAQSEKRAEEAGNQPGAGASGAPLTGELKQQSSALGKAFKQFTLYNVALRAVKRALREAVQTVKELDKELTEQAMVTGLTREQTYKLVKSYQDLAQQTGATTKEIAGVATEYMKQGKSIQEAMILTEAAVSAAKVARVSTADSVNYLTTALNGFQLSAEDAMKVSDKFAAVAAASATDYDELAIALSKVASQANLAGMSIDYTTALLTKGLETTREAPETMGTALKTIIARMRELSDYGETLEGDTDINNVESQLAYVGIALRNAEGELRSTEEVLDELGKKWDTLDKNQQAAVAKALAGTRQQSRLIAMMTDYERVTELQEIAQRSAGATAAQAGVYLEGIEAALNKITIGWEKIVTAISDSEIIITFLDHIGVALDNIGEFLNTDFGIVSTLTIIGVLGLTMLGNAIRKYEISKMQNKLTLQQLIAQQRENIASQKEIVLEKKIAKELAWQRLQKAEGLDIKTDELRALSAELKARGKDTTLLDQQIQSLESKEDIEKQAAIEAYDRACVELDREEQKLALYEEQAVSLASQTSLWSRITSGASGLMIPLISIIGLYTKMAKAINVVIYRKKQEKKQTDSNLVSQTQLTGMTTAESAAQNGPAGWIIALAILAAFGIAIGVAGAALFNTGNQADTATGQINKLSNEIYKLQEKANAISQIVNEFERFDNQIIKTKKDIEEMNSLLDQAGDKLSSETTRQVWKTNFWGKKVLATEEVTEYGGLSEKEFYESLPSDSLKLSMLKSIERSSRETAYNYRRAQIELFRNNPGLLDKNTADTELKRAQTNIYSNAIYNLQDYVDSLVEANDLSAEAAKGVEELTQSLLEEADISQALDFSDYPEQVELLVDKMKDLTMNAKNANGELEKISTSIVFTSDDYSILEKAKAFRQIENALSKSSEEYALFAAAYQDYAVFANMSDDVLHMIDSLRISADDINNFNEQWSIIAGAGIDIDQETWKSLITDANGFLDTFAKTGNNVKATIDQVFGTYLDGATNYVEAYNLLVKSFSNLVSVGMLNMGQNITKLKNTVNGFYEKAAEWNEMTDQEKTDFMSDNMDLFKGQSGKELLDALNNNNWLEIEKILQQSTAMQKKIQDELQWIDVELSVEMAKIGQERNEAYIQQLRAWKAELEDQTSFFRADLQLLIDQEKSQLDIYKDFLEKQKKQLEESLEERKEAYQKYFDAINEQVEDLDYEEQSDQLITNLSKLATSTDFASERQIMELEQQLEDLEKERQETLRTRAQEAVIEAIDSEVEEINNKFDRLLNNSELLLEAMQGSMQDPTFLTQILASAREEGMTALELESFAEEVKNAFSNENIGTDNIKEVLEQVINNATINVGDRTFDLDTEDGNEMWKTILDILIKYGYGR